MNFRHPFELGLAQFSPILLFEVSRGVLQTGPEANFALVLQDCDTLFSFTCTQDQRNLGIIENMSSAFQLFPLSFPILVSNLPSSIFQADMTQTHTQTPTCRHTQLFVHHIFVLADYPEKGGWKESEVILESFTLPVLHVLPTVL